MKYFFIYAHPAPTSLSGFLMNRAVQLLQASGHEVIVSDLYAMKWKAVADENDFPGQQTDTGSPLNYAAASRKAFSEGTQSPDVAEEQQKLLWADVVIIQFPIWWYGMPAILKGWFDRVYANGFAYGVGQHGGNKWGDRFGEGVMKGRRAMVAMTVGGRMAHYGPRGVNGAMDDVLWPIQHGLLFYPGFTVIPPAIFYEVGNADDAAVEVMAKTYIKNLLEADQVEPIPFRSQNGGDYDDVQVLKQELDNGFQGHTLHQDGPVFISNISLGKPGNYSPQHFAPDSRS